MKLLLVGFGKRISTELTLSMILGTMRLSDILDPSLVILLRLSMQTAKLHFTPKEALSILDVLSSRIKSVRDNYEKCCKAKELLNLSPGDTQKLENLK